VRAPVVDKGPARNAPFGEGYYTPIERLGA
jgi:hypothetical protein